MNSTSVNYQDWEPVVFTKKPKEIIKKENTPRPAGNKELTRLMEDELMLQLIRLFVCTL